MRRRRKLYSWHEFRARNHGITSQVVLAPQNRRRIYMRLNYVVLVAAATLLALANALSTAATDLELAGTPDFQVSRALTDGQDDAAAIRFLRVEKAKTQDEEERKIPSNLVTKFGNLFKTGAASTLTKQAETAATKLTPQSKLTEQMLAKQQSYLDDAFTRLKIDKVEGNIFKDTKLKEWVKQRQSFNRKNHIKDDAGIPIVSKYFKNDVQLSNWIESARLDPKLKSMADQFRAGQLSQWLKGGKHPDDVYRLLNVKRWGKISENRDLWRNYKKAYSWYTNGGTVVL